MWESAIARDSSVFLISRKILLDLLQWNPVVCSVHWTVYFEMIPTAEPRFSRMDLVVMLDFFSTFSTVRISIHVTFGFQPCPLRFSPVQLFLITLSNTAAGIEKDVDMAFLDLWTVGADPYWTHVSSPQPSTNQLQRAAAAQWLSSFKCQLIRVIKMIRKSLDCLDGIKLWIFPLS